MKLFECGIRYEKTLENGMQKKVTELYIVDALSFTEAESRIIGEMSCFISGEFAVVSEKITNYSELVSSDISSADKWYKVKINLITLDEKTMNEKKAPLYLLVQASDIDDARKRLNEHMKGTMSDWGFVKPCRKQKSWMCSCMHLTLLTRRHRLTKIRLFRKQPMPSQVLQAASVPPNVSSTAFPTDRRLPSVPPAAKTW